MEGRERERLVMLIKSFSNGSIFVLHYFTKKLLLPLFTISVRRLPLGVT